MMCSEFVFAKTGRVCIGVSMRTCVCALLHTHPRTFSPWTFVLTHINLHQTLLRDSFFLHIGMYLVNTQEPSLYSPFSSVMRGHCKKKKRKRKMDVVLLIRGLQQQLTIKLKAVTKQHSGNILFTS